MRYILLVAGKGTRLHPITLQHPKSLFRLDEHTTVLKRMVELIKREDPSGEIIVVDGFMKTMIEAAVEGVAFITNPFYEVTNSLASLWFARDYLSGEAVIINGDVVVSEALFREVIKKKIVRPSVLMDSSILNEGDYNVQVNGDRVVVMSKALLKYDGEYAGITKLDSVSSELVRKKMDEMIEAGRYDQWYENALVQMIFENNFELFYEDVSNYEWTEVDSVNDLVYAKNIHEKEFTTAGREKSDDRAEKL